MVYTVVFAIHYLGRSSGLFWSWKWETSLVTVQCYCFEAVNVWTTNLPKPGDIFHFERSGRRAPRARELSPGVGAGAPPAKIPSTFQIAKAVTEVVAEAPAVYQLGGRGPLPAELLVRQVSLGATSPLPRDLLPRDPVPPNEMVSAAAPTVEAPIGPMVSAPTAAGPTSPEALDAPSPEELPMVSFRRWGRFKRCRDHIKSYRHMIYNIIYHIHLYTCNFDVARGAPSLVGQNHVACHAVPIDAYL